MRHFLILCGWLLACTALILLIIPASTGNALPEYAAQTGEPCSSCHVSPSGGGARGPRGQAWVASGKQSSVPALVTSLELLGVELKANPEDFKAGSEPVEPAEALTPGAAQQRRIFEMLSGYDGN